MASIKVSNPNNVKIYTINGQTNSRSIPDWLARKNKRKLKGDEDWTKRVELIQEFEFHEASLRVKTTRDGMHAMATGVYKPQIRVYEFSEMSLKFERHTDAENVNFLILSDDWTKSVHLQSDRSIEFHSQSQMHYKTRIPKFGRDLAYHYPSCDLLVVGATNEVYRLNLDQGRFLNPLVTSASPEHGINCVDINPAHQLYSFGTADGNLEFWDPRSRSKITSLTPILPSRFGIKDTDSLEITKLKFKDDGLNMAVGLDTGHVLLYDIRNPNPYLVKDHQYGLPIKSLQWINDVNGDTANSKICSSDAKVVKLWNANDGTHFTSIEPQNDINDCWVVPNSGLIFLANEGIQMQSYYIPSLGPAPKWCSFLDNLTEELEENPTQTVYEDYKFVTRKELNTLSLEHLIGSNVLRAYMHGFLIDLRLYEQAKLITNPFAFDDYRQNQITKKVDEGRGSRIQATQQKTLPKVNAGLAQKLMDESTTRKSKGKLLQDDRFKSLFQDPEFEVNQDDSEFKMLNPTSAQNLLSSAPTRPDEEDSEKEGKGSDEDSSDDDDLLGWKGQGHRREGRAAQYHDRKEQRGRGGSASRGGQRGAFRGASRGASRGGSRGASRGGSRGASRGGSRGASRGGSRGGRGDSRGNSRGGARGGSRGRGRRP